MTYGDMRLSCGFHAAFSSAQNSFSSFENVPKALAITITIGVYSALSIAWYSQSDQIFVEAPREVKRSGQAI